MNIHEYQTKQILKKYGVDCHNFRVVSKIEDIDQALDSLGIEDAVVKVQVHAGGRGKAGGVKVAKGKKEIKKIASEMIGMKIVTNQTGSDGIIAHKVMIAELADIEKEYYFSIIVDRKQGSPLIMASPEGGMEIEEIAKTAPEKILKQPFSLEEGITDRELEKVADFMQWDGETKEQGMRLVKGLTEAFIENDGSILEINPLMEDPDGKLWALDAKMSIDDNALFRHPNLAELYDPTQESAAEVIAHKEDLAYIALEGTIGCMVNGAGLAMATMDLIKLHGAEPANFLDVGGSASKEKVAQAFRLILSDKSVRGILVNIFGGIMKCDIIAEGIIAAAKEIKIEVPLVVRLEGTNVEKGKKLLEGSGLSIIAADDLTDAAKKIVSKVKACQS